jgi:hypothetical protein
MRKTRTTALHPQSDGQTERQNRTLIDVLSKLARENPREWDDQLCFAMSAYRSSVHSVTGETPNRLMLGREVATPVTLLTRLPNEQPVVPWVDGLRRRFEETYRTVIETTKTAQRATKTYADRRQKGIEFDEGQLVWLYDPKPHRGQPHKLDANKWSGPWTVAKKLSFCVYLILRNPTDKTGRIVNVDRLKPFIPRPEALLPRWEDASSEMNPDYSSNLNSRRNAPEHIDSIENNEDLRSHNEDQGVSTAPALAEPDPLFLHDPEEEFRNASFVTRAGRHARRPHRFDDYDL